MSDNERPGDRRSQRARQRQEQEGLQNIKKRAERHENAMLRNFVTDGINPMNSFHLRHAKLMAFVAMESFHNTFFHFIETMKVRSQARNLKSGDVSHYFKNQVEKKPLISGVVSGFLGAATGAFTFISIHDMLTV